MSTSALSSTERLAQLKRYTALYDDALYRSALLMIGVQLCTITTNEEWFMEQALSLYARCLTKLGQHRRATRYYERALHYQKAVTPSELLQPITSAQQPMTESSASNNNDITSSSAARNGPRKQQPSQAASATVGTSGCTSSTLTVPNASQLSEKDRDQVKDNLIKKMAQMHGIKRKATHSGASQLPREGPDLARSPFYMYEDRQQRAKTVRVGDHDNVGGNSSLGATDHRPIVPSSSSASAKVAAGTGGTIESQIGVAAGTATSTLIESTLGRTKGMDFDARLQYAKSLIETGDLVRAARELASFPTDKRTVEFYLLNIRMSRQKRAVISQGLSKKDCWERIAERHPVAIEAYTNLLRCKVPLEKVLGLIPDSCTEKTWMAKYLTGINLVLQLKYQDALKEFELLNVSYRSNVDILLKMALCHFWLGAPVDAYLHFLSVQKVDRCATENIYLFASILKDLEKESELTALVMDLMQHEEKLAETWIVHSIYCLLHKDITRAITSVNQALRLDPEHAGAHLIRGQLLLDTDPKEALMAFREATRLQKSILSYEGLVNAYLAQSRPLEAIAAAKECKNDLPTSARALALYGTTLFKTNNYDPPETALQILQTALDMDPSSPEATMGLVMVLEHQKEYTKALALLDNLLESAPLLEGPVGAVAASRPLSVVQIHLRKAELYNAMADWEKCFLSYQRALVVDPSNEAAKLGLAQVERIFQGGGDEEEDEDEEGDQDEGGIGEDDEQGHEARPDANDWSDDDNNHHGGGEGLEEDSGFQYHPEHNDVDSLHHQVYEPPSRTAVTPAAPMDMDMADPFAASASARRAHPSGDASDTLYLRRRVTDSPDFLDDDDDDYYDDLDDYHPESPPDTSTQSRRPRYPITFGFTGDTATEVNHEGISPAGGGNGPSASTPAGLMMRDGRTPFPRVPGATPAIQIPAELMLTPALRRQQRYTAEGGGRGRGIGRGDADLQIQQHQNTPSFAAASRLQQARARQIAPPPTGSAVRAMVATASATAASITTVTVPRRRPSATAAQREREYEEEEEEEEEAEHME